MKQTMRSHRRWVGCSGFRVVRWFLGTGTGLALFPGMVAGQSTLQPASIDVGGAPPAGTHHPVRAPAARALSRSTANPDPGPYSLTVGTSADAGWTLADGEITATAADAHLNVNTLRDNLLLGNVTVVAGVDVTVTVSLTPPLTETRTLTLRAGRDVVVRESVAIAPTGGVLNLVFWSDADADSVGGVLFDVSSSLNSRGGHIWVGGGSATSPATTWNGLPVGSGPAVGLTATATGLGSNPYAGIHGVGELIDAGAGDLSMHGRSTSELRFGIGVRMNRPGLSGMAISAQNITIVGVGSPNADSTGDTNRGNWGVGIENTTLTGGIGGEISILGTGGGQKSGSATNGGGANHGIFMSSNSAILARGSGDLRLTGFGGGNPDITANTDNDGIHLAGGTLRVESGALILEAVEGLHAAAQAFDFRGTTVLESRTGGALSAGPIILRGDALALASGVRIRSLGRLTLEPAVKSGGFGSIGIGGAAGTLQLPVGYFATQFVDGFSEIVVGGLATEKVTVAGALAYHDPLILKARGDLEVRPSSTLTGASGQQASLVFWADVDGSGEGSIFLNEATVSTGGGHLWLGGGGGTASWNGLSVGDGFAEGGTVNAGISLFQSSVATDGGHLALYGRSDEASPSPGVDLDTSTLETSTAGAAAGSLVITASALALRGAGVSYSFTSALNAVDVLTGDAGAVSFRNAGALTLGALQASGPVDVRTLEGDMILSGPVATTGTGADALLLAAGASRSAEDASGGDIKVPPDAADPVISVGAGGTARLYSGSFQGSTGLQALASDRRFGVDLTTALDPAPGPGTVALFRSLRDLSSDPGITLDAVPAQVYTTAPLEPTVVVVADGSTTLTLTTDYTVAYTDNVDAGTATLTITGAGAYIGTKTATFEITPAPITVEPTADQSKLAGAADPVFTYTLSPVLPDGVSVTGGLGRTTGEEVGTYAFTVGDLSAGPNYTLSLAPGAPPFSILFGGPALALQVTAPDGSALSSPPFRDQLRNLPFHVRVALVDTAGNPVLNTGSPTTLTLTASGGVVAGSLLRAGAEPGAPVTAVLGAGEQAVLVQGVVYSGLSAPAGGDVVLQAVGSAGGLAAGQVGSSAAITVRDIAFTVGASESELIADGVSTTAITVTLTDRSQPPLPQAGQEIRMFASFGTLLLPDGATAVTPQNNTFTTNAQGEVVGLLLQAGEAAGTATVTARCPGDCFAQAAVVFVEAPEIEDLSPNPPAAFEVQPLEGGAEIRWSQPSSEETAGLPVLHYVMDVWREGDRTWARRILAVDEVASAGPMHTLRMTGLENGSRYRVRLAVVTEGGMSDFTPWSAPITPQAPVLKVELRLLEGAPVIGEEMTLEIRVTNTGPTRAEGTWVTQGLQEEELSVLSTEVSQGAIAVDAAGARFWQVGVLEVGAHAVLTLRVRTLDPDDPGGGGLE